MSEVSLKYNTLISGNDTYELSTDAAMALSKVFADAQMKHDTLDEVGTYLGYRQPGARPHCYGPDDVVVDGDWLRFNENQWRANARRATRVRSLHVPEDGVCQECRKVFPCPTYFSISGATLRHGNQWFLDNDVQVLTRKATQELIDLAEEGETFLSAQEKAQPEAHLVIDFYVNRGMGDCLMSSYINKDDERD